MFVHDGLTWRYRFTFYFGPNNTIITYSNKFQEEYLYEPGFEGIVYREVHVHDDLYDEYPALIRAVGDRKLIEESK